MNFINYKFLKINDAKIRKNKRGKLQKKITKKYLK